MTVWGAYRILSTDIVTGPILTVEGPAILDLNGHTVDSSDLTTCIRIIGKGATVKNGIVAAGYIGIEGSELDGALIKDIIATDNAAYGIYLDGNNYRLQNVTAQGTYYFGEDSAVPGSYYEYGAGIDVYGNNNRLHRVTAVGNLDYNILVGGNNNQIKDCYVAGSYAGIFLFGNNNTFISNIVDSHNNCIKTFDGNVIKNNTVRNCNYGVMIEGNNTIVAHNKFYSNGRASITATMSWSHSNRIIGNRITKTSGNGIELDFVRKTVVDSNVIVDSAENGIVLGPSSAGCTVKSNIVRKCGMAGLRIRGADGNNVTANNVSSCSRGINAGLGSNRNRLINNRASNNTVFDLSDMSANCGSNVWKGNTGKGNIACTLKK